VRVEGPFAGKLATGRSVELYYVYNGLNVVSEYDRWGQLAANYDFGLPGGLAQPVQWQLLGNRLHSGLGGSAAGGRSSSAEAGAGAGWVPDFGPPGDLIRANFAAEGERFYFHDALGSTTMLAGFPPAVSARHEYGPWGAQLTTPQPSLNRINFTTYRHEAETGLEYAIARYYNTGLGRFLQPDPLVAPLFRGGLHPEKSSDVPVGWSPNSVRTSPYLYGEARPLNGFDPDGWRWWVKDDQDPIWEPAGFVNHEWEAWFKNNGYQVFRRKNPQDEYVYRVPHLGGEVIRYYGITEQGEPYCRVAYFGLIDLPKEVFELYLEVSQYVGYATLLKAVAGRIIVKGLARLATRNIPAQSGQWVLIARGAGAALEHQSAMSGQPILRIGGKSYILEFEVNGTLFDDVLDGVLIDYKDNYANFIEKQTGRFYGWFTGAAKMRIEAMKQIKAAGGRTIIWKVGPYQVTAFRHALADIDGIIIEP